MEETGAIQHSVESETGETRNTIDAIFLEQFIGEEAASLMGILRSYVLQYTGSKNLDRGRAGNKIYYRTSRQRMIRKSNRTGGKELFQLPFLLSRQKDPLYLCTRCTEKIPGQGCEHE